MGSFVSILVTVSGAESARGFDVTPPTARFRRLLGLTSSLMYPPREQRPHPAFAEAFRAYSNYLVDIAGMLGGQTLSDAIARIRERFAGEQRVGCR